MKASLVLMVLSGALALGQNLARAPCENKCPQVKCATDDPKQLCECMNNRERKCKEICPSYKPVIQNCPTCECEQVMCVQSWPESCYCANAAAETCYKKCGGKKPSLTKCPAYPSTTLSTKTAKPTPSSLPKNPICGGGRANNLQCAEGYTCITDPWQPGSCGPACDALGICAKDKICGGFGGFKCEVKGMVCKDDPRDECDPKNGGADCAGLCVWPQ